ncbi:LOW QUALITY PROTEIN: hypothetical protein RJ639_001969 [Escallonia herrerae]|uniref:Uncharacterized protein n=1 Tax=Escallonia herrerae TaxID=1293975 RepID=A0AA88XBZ6_9ASTE|nr:LOW QUALITY PROTEIN: hypothetical protein RJ639_001969 [Escallonia herrerae]
MAAVFKSFVAAMFLTCLVREGFCEECSLDTINVLTERTGVEIQGKPEWKTVEPVDPNVVARSADGRCLLIHGNSLVPSATTSLLLNAPRYGNDRAHILFFFFSFLGNWGCSSSAFFACRIFLQVSVLSKGFDCSLERFAVVSRMAMVIMEMTPQVFVPLPWLGPHLLWPIEGLFVFNIMQSRDGLVLKEVKFFKSNGSSRCRSSSFKHMVFFPLHGLLSPGPFLTLPYLIIHSCESRSYLPNLSVLRLSSNHFTGLIPPSFGNLSSLQTLTLNRNNLEGNIPFELGRLSNLLSTNNLSGMVPLPLYNISTMTFHELTLNNFSGSLPSDLGLTLPNLRGFYGGGNKFSGPFPTSLANASKLVDFDIPQNSLTGTLPTNLGGLWHLQLFQVSVNHFGNNKSNDLSFLNSLSNCTNIGIFRHSFGGVSPSSIANFSTKLVSLRLGKNYVSGNIPQEFGNLCNLGALY